MGLGRRRFRKLLMRGMWDVMKLVEHEIIRDSEDNPIHPIFSTDEWWEPSEDMPQTLNCSDCSAELDTVGDF